LQLVREILKIRQRHHYRLIGTRLIIPYLPESSAPALTLIARQVDDMIFTSFLKDEQI
jgi:hypothetical protein